MKEVIGIVILSLIVLLVVASIAFLLWFGVSWASIMFQNLDMDEPTVLSSWNLFSFIGQERGQSPLFSVVGQLFRKLIFREQLDFWAFGKGFFCQRTIPKINF